MSIINSIHSQLAPIHREGYPFIGGFALLSLVLFLVWSPFGWIGTVMTLWCAYFFRDPVRVTPVREGIVVSPADGRVSQIVNASPRTENQSSFTDTCTPHGGSSVNTGRRGSPWSSMGVLQVSSTAGG